MGIDASDPFLGVLAGALDEGFTDLDSSDPIRWLSTHQTSP
jgi:hypothetical protein